jgi:hypothetical protein
VISAAQKVWKVDLKNRCYSKIDKKGEDEQI